MKNLFLAFLKEELPLLSDIDVYNLYKTYRDKAFESLVDGDNEEHLKYEEYVKILKSEILNRIDSECW